MRSDGLPFFHAVHLHERRAFQTHGATPWYAAFSRIQELLTMKEGGEHGLEFLKVLPTGFIDPSIANTCSRGE